MDGIINAGHHHENARILRGGMTPELSETNVKTALKTQWLGQNYTYYPRTNSTNDLVKEALAHAETADPPTGSVYLTDFQEKGRGRLARRWEAPTGTSLLLSTLFRPSWPANKLPWLTMLAGLAVVKTIEEQTQVAAALKWPNDVLLKDGDTWCKVCGILLESQIVDDINVAYAILGTGINVNIPREELPKVSPPATSLLAATGQKVLRLPLLARLLENLESIYDRADSGLSPQGEWNQRLLTLGKSVSIQPFDGSPALIGLAEATDEWGQLLVRTADEQLHTIAAGDVTLREAAAR